MKNIFPVLGCLFFLTSTSFAQQVEFKGKIQGVKTGKIYLLKFYNKMFTPLKEAKIDNGQFSFSYPVKLPEVYGISMDTATSDRLYLFLDKGTKQINLEVPSTGMENAKVNGSTGNDVFQQYLNGSEDQKIDSFILKNPKSVASVYILYRMYSYRLTPDEIERNMALLDPSFQNTQYFDVLRNLVKILRRVEPGNKAIDFSLPDTTGKELKLSDHFGNYLLLDFWASWCGPCRRENPNLVRVYQKFHSKGFDIFGVSLDSKKENWKKAIQNDHLTWTHVSDLQYWNSKAAGLYGIRAIPSNVLIDPKGIIVARNLEGEDLEKKLEEIFGK